MRPFVIAGIGTNVGKTIVSTIVCEAVSSDYWKPIQSGVPLDSHVVKALSKTIFCHKEIYLLKHPLAPTSAALKEKRLLNPYSIQLPKTNNRLVIEGCGGVMVPINENLLLSDIFCLWNPFWIIVSKHYLGSINHTLLTHSFLKSRSQDILGIIFNGKENQESEDIILKHTSLPCLGRIKKEKELNYEKIRYYAKQLQHLASLYTG